MRLGPITCACCALIYELEIRLRSHTAFRSGPASRTASCIASLYSAVRDGNDIKLPVYETAGAYFFEGNQRRLPVIPQIPVSFSYGEFSRRYTLEVLAGFSSQRQRTIKVCVTIRDLKKEQLHVIYRSYLGAEDTDSESSTLS